jgi:1-acyl-sn-glycerol-3-phosphate acyltransferase
LDRYAAVWVKAKYYQNPAMAWILDRFNNIPIPSMGYLLVKDFETACSRAPEQDEYELLKSFADGALPEAELRDRLARRQPDSRLQLSKFLHLESQEGPTDWRTSVLLRFDELMREVVRLNQDALALGLDIIVFPQGTRSKRISRGFTGAAQMILATGAPVLPVGASGVDRMFPGGSPLPSAGVATFRIGELLRPGHELKPFEEGPAFIPFTPEAKKQEPRFQALTDLLMDRINNLVDPEYQRDGREQAKTGVTRFV